MNLDDSPQREAVLFEDELRGLERFPLDSGNDAPLGSQARPDLYESPLLERGSSPWRLSCDEIRRDRLVEAVPFMSDVELGLRQDLSCRG